MFCTCTRTHSSSTGAVTHSGGFATNDKHRRPDVVKPTTSPDATAAATDDNAMTTVELKQAIIAMMKRKDEVDDENRSDSGDVRI